MPKKHTKKNKKKREKIRNKKKKRTEVSNRRVEQIYIYNIYREREHGAEKKSKMKNTMVPWIIPG